MEPVDFDPDPEVADEDDPEYQAEMFATFRELGWKPEDLKNPKDTRAYSEWLKTAAPDED